MTDEERKAVTTVLLGSFPSQVAAWGKLGISAFVAELEARGLTAERAIDAIRAHDGKFGAPTAGGILAIADRQLQGPAPTFLEAHREIASRITLLDYHRPASTFDAFVARLAEKHEAVARFALALGPTQVRQMPDPTAGDSFAAGRFTKDYAATVQAWEDDPRPGLAVAEARAVLERGAGEAVAVARRELTSGGDEQ